VLVTGGGSIGQLVSEVALSRGATVVLSDVVTDKLELAERRGVDHTVDATSTDLVSVINEHVDSEGVDTVIESSGADSAIEVTTDSVKRGGIITFVGIPLDKRFPTDVVSIIAGEYDIRGSFRFSETYKTAIEGVSTGKYDVDSIVSFEQPFSETQAAFDRAIEPESVKGIVRVSSNLQ
jgi:L-iditol 2-dehydrogenase